MAANYLTSTQNIHWQRAFNKSTKSAVLSRETQKLQEQFAIPECRHLFFHFNQQLGRLGRRLAIRQPVLATAMVFLHRFYAHVEIRRTNPYLVLSTAFYLACKTEEFPQHIRVVVSEARSLWTDLVPSDIVRYGECEFSIISELNAQLIVYHPYRNLQQLQLQLSLSTDEMTLAWSIINDHYSTKMPLSCAPNTIAGSAVILAIMAGPFHGAQMSKSNSSMPLQMNRLLNAAMPAAFIQLAQSKGQRLVGWLSQDEVKIEVVVECIQQMISLYTILDQYDEKDCRDSLATIIKTQRLDR